MAIESNILKTEDTVKRGKLIALSLLIGLSMFVQTLIKNQDVSVQRIVITGLIYFVFSFLGLIWAFNFQVKIKSLPFLVHSSLFILAQYLFIQLFFVEKFSRIYEGLLLLVLVALVSIGSYISFLMSNVFNVNLYKNIPLADVGRTASFVISTLCIFFLTFSFLSLQLPVYILLPLQIIISVFFSNIHLRNLGYEGFVLVRKTVLVSTIVLIMYLASFLGGVLHEVSALSPTVGYFVGIGVANIKRSNSNYIFEMIMYVLALIAAIVLNFAFNIFS